VRLTSFICALFLAFSVYGTESQEEKAPTHVLDALGSVVTVSATLTFLVKGGTADFDKRGTGFVLNTHGDILTVWHIPKDLVEMLKRTTMTGVLTYAVNIQGYEKPLVAYSATPYGPYSAGLFVLTTVYPPNTNLKFKPIPLGNFDFISVGDRVYALANPLMPTRVAEGTIVQKDKQALDDKFAPLVPFLYTTTPITYGYSGGPLLNERGEVLGVTEGCSEKKIAPGKFECAHDGYFIPINLVKKWLDAQGIKYETLHENTSDASSPN